MEVLSSAEAGAFRPAVATEKLNERVLALIEYLGGALLALDVAIVFASVVARYFFHEPFDWAEEVASGLMSTMIFLGRRPPSGAPTISASISSWRCFQNAGGASSMRSAPG